MKVRVCKHFNEIWGHWDYELQYKSGWFGQWQHLHFFKTENEAICAAKVYEQGNLVTYESEGV